MKRVVITGVGIVSSLGQDYEAFCSRLAAGEIAIEPAPWAAPDAGLHVWVSPVIDFNPLCHMEKRVVEGTDRFAQYAICAAQQAVIDHGAELEPHTGVVLGTTMAGVGSLVEAQRLLDTEGREAVPRKLNLQAWPNSAAAQLAIRWGLHGMLMTVSTACASGLDAIGMAAEAIESGRADVMIAGGAERGFCEVMFRSQQTYGMVQSVGDPELAMLPFDKKRSGLVEGEGAAVVVLESAERAAARGARVYGTVKGYASLSDGYHPSAPDPSGKWEVAVMRQALERAEIAAEDIGAIIAHATSTPKGDAVEIAAINEVFGNRTESLKVTSLKGSVGHTGAASGAMATLVGLRALCDGILPPVGGTRDVEEAAAFEVVIGEPSIGDFGNVQINAFGFGGQNASLVVGRP